MSDLIEFQYVTGEDEREFPHIPVGLAEDGETPLFTGAVLNVGDRVEASENPDPTRFVEYEPPAKPLTTKQRKALEAEAAQQLAAQAQALEAAEAEARAVLVGEPGPELLDPPVVADGSAVDTSTD